MSVGFAESNEETSRELFYKKMVYLATLGSYQYKNLVDFGFAEKRLYGRVSRHFEPIVLSELPNTKLKNFTSVADTQLLPSALPFVVDAFEKLKQQFDKCAQEGKISTSDTYLSSLKVHKAYSSPKKSYKKHIEEVGEGIAFNIKESTPKIKNFDQFISKLMPILETVNRDYPFTLAAFVKSTLCSINTSALAVEIADLESDNDLEKIKKIVQSPNWEFYVNACNSYGFMVDVRNPWRIVADIASPAILEHAAAYGLKNTDLILGVAYEKTYLVKHFEAFKETLLQLYNMSKENRIHESYTCPSGQVLMRTTTPRQYTPRHLSKLYSDNYFLDLYFRIRFSEEESFFSEGEKNRIRNECGQIANFDLGESLNSFERILNKTLDYSGAINYIMERQELLAQ